MSNEYQKYLKRRERDRKETVRVTFIISAITVLLTIFNPFFDNSLYNSSLVKIIMFILKLAPLGWIIYLANSIVSFLGSLISDSFKNPDYLPPNVNKANNEFYSAAFTLLISIGLFIYINTKLEVIYETVVPDTVKMIDLTFSQFLNMIKEYFYELLSLFSTHYSS